MRGTGIMGTILALATPATAVTTSQPAPPATPDLDTTKALATLALATTRAVAARAEAASRATSQARLSTRPSTTRVTAAPAMEVTASTLAQDTTMAEMQLQVQEAAFSTIGLKCIDCMLSCWFCSTLQLCACLHRSGQEHDRLDYTYIAHLARAKHTLRSSLCCCVLSSIHAGMYGMLCTCHMCHMCITQFVMLSAKCCTARHMIALCNLILLDIVLGLLFELELK